MPKLKTQEQSLINVHAELYKFNLAVVTHAFVHLLKNRNNYTSINNYELELLQDIVILPSFLQQTKSQSDLPQLGLEKGWDHCPLY